MTDEANLLRRQKPSAEELAVEDNPATCGSAGED